MRLTRRKLRRIIREEKVRLAEQVDDDRVSELSEYSNSKSGRKLMQEGSRVSSAGRNISALSEEQTGTMRRTLVEIGQFVENLGGALESLNSVSEGGSATDKLPTVSEFKKMIKEIQRLEK